MQDCRTRVFFRGAGPLQRAFFQSLVIYASVAGCKSGDFLHNCFRVFKIEALGPHAPGNLAGYPPVGLALADRLDGLPYPLHAALRVGEGAFFFRKAAGRQDDIGKLGSLREEDVLHQEELKSIQGFTHVLAVGVAQGWVFSHEVNGFDITVMGGRDNLGKCLARFRVQFGSPGFLEFLLHFLVRYGLVAGVDIRERPHVAGALDIVLTAQRVHARARFTDIAGKHG